MNTAEWIIVAILSTALIIFLIVGIVLLVKMISISDEVKKIVMEGQDIAKNANGIVNNIKGMTSIGGTVELFITSYVIPKLRDKIKEAKESKERKAKNGARAEQ